MKEHWRARFSRWVEVDADDPTEKRRGQFLSYCILGALVFLVFLVVINGGQWLLAPAAHGAEYVAGGLLSALILTGLWRLNRAGRTRWAGYGFLIFSTVAISVLSPPLILDRMLSLPVLAASFIIAPASSFFIAGLAFASRMLVYLASGDLISHNVISTAALFLVAIIAWLVADQQGRYVGQVAHLNGVLRAIRSVNQLIAREKDRQRLLQTSCELLTEARGYRSAWIVHTNSDGVPIMTAEAGIGTPFSALQERWLGGQMPGCARQALEQSDAFRVRDPTITCADCPLVDITGRPGACAVRLAHEGTIFGVLVVSGPLEFLTSQEERALLEEVAGDLAFGLHSIDLEAQQKQAEEALRQSEEKYRKLFQNAQIGMYRSKLDGSALLAVNRKLCEIFGYSEEEMLDNPATIRWADPGERDRMVAQLLQVGFLLDHEIDILTKSGAVRTCSVSIQLYPDQGYIEGSAIDITERKRALEAIQSQAKFPGENPSPVLRVASNSTLLYANAVSRPLLALWGCEVGTRLPEDLQRVVLESFAANTSREIEVICGDTIYSLIFVPLVDAGYTNIYGRDITEGKRAAEVLRESEARLQTIFDVLPVGIALLNQDRQILQMNPALQRIVEMSEKGLMHSAYKARQYIHPGGTPMSTAEFPSTRALVEHRAIHDVEIGIVKGDGAIVWTSVSAAPITSADSGVVTVTLDITERKRAEEALQRYAERLAAINRLDRVIASNLEIDLVYDSFVKELLSLVPLDRTSLVLLNEAGDQWQVTRQWTQHQAVILPGEWWPVKGSAKEWLVTNRVPFLEREIGERGTWIEAASLQREGLRSRLLVPLIIQERVVGALTVASRQPAAFSEEDQAILTAIADQLAIAIRNSRLYEQVQRHAAELEQRVLQRTAELESANRELEAFAYSVSHDLRAPLRAIDGYAHMLTEDYQARLDDEGQRILGVVRDEARRMGQLIDDLLTFSRLGQQAMHKVATDMTALARQIFDELRQEAPERVVSLRLADLPPAEADPSLLHQVWMNLLGNALKFTRGRAPAEIEVGSTVQGHEVAYYVKDNGVGFDMQYADKLFGVFQRLHGQDEFEGTGVGLALVQRIILRHGGRVWAEAQEDQGATFYFSLPRHKEASA